jgi:hypothetical protein
LLKSAVVLVSGTFFVSVPLSIKYLKIINYFRES